MISRKIWLADSSVRPNRFGRTFGEVGRSSMNLQKSYFWRKIRHFDGHLFNLSKIEWHFYSSKKSKQAEKVLFSHDNFPILKFQCQFYLEIMNVCMQVKCEKYSLFHYKKVLNFNLFSARGSAEGSAEPLVKYTEPVRPIHVFVWSVVH